jgi:hypothetical protein
VDSRNLLVFTVYCIVVVYVFYQAYKSLGNQVVVELDSRDLNRQLDEEELRDVVDIKFRFRDSYRLDELTRLMLIMKNISEETTIRVDWDESSIADFDNSTDRVIRLAPGTTEIPQKQVITPLLPGQSLESELTGEKAIPGSLFKPAKLKNAADRSKPFRLRLVLTTSHLGSDQNFHSLSCQFFPQKLRWTKALTIAMKPKKPK